jgi:hypothetical protein
VTALKRRLVERGDAKNSRSGFQKETTIHHA